jgi:membrane protein DedA with SNARE-associated domain
MPIPEEAAIVLAGVLSAQGHLHTGMAFAACLAGAIIGDSFMYGIGYRWGHRIFTSHPRFAKLLASEADKEDEFQRAIENHSLKVMLLARFLVGVRAPVYVMTGVVRMPYKKFLFYDVISATAVVGVVFTLSYFFGTNVQEWVQHAEFFATLVVVGIVAIIGGVLYYRHRREILEFVFGADAPPAETQSAPPSRENP